MGVHALPFEAAYLHVGVVIVQAELIVTVEGGRVFVHQAPIRLPVLSKLVGELLEVVGAVGVQRMVVTETVVHTCAARDVVANEGLLFLGMVQNRSDVR